MNNNVKIEQITSQKIDFAKWYTDVCRKAELMDYSTTKGFIIYRPYGYALWEAISNYLDKRFKQSGHENVYMPLVIPESLFNKEKEHVKGFAPETLIATIGGQQKLEERLIIRPTSEAIFCEHFSKIISSYRDLPKKYNQWCSVVRWEKTTRPFLRGAEFLWQEGHTAHTEENEARQEALHILEIYRDLGSELLAIPFILGRKTDQEKFAGAKETYGIEALMHDGKSLQSGTTHYFGTGFAEAFDIKFQDKTNQLQYVHQTSWGVSTRLIGSVIMVHGDDNGLVLPPFLAPIQVVIIPIQQTKKGVLEKTRQIESELTHNGVRVKVDDSDQSPGWKFAEHEMKGVPIRIEIGPRDLEQNVFVLVKRNDGTKQVHSLDQLTAIVQQTLKTIHQQMYQKAVRFLEDNTHVAQSFDQFKQIINDKSGYIKMMWCGDPKCENHIKQETTATARILPFDEKAIGDKCGVCGKDAEHLVIFAKAY